MTLYQFNALDETEQHEAVWNDGVMVGDRMDVGHRIVLTNYFPFMLSCIKMSNIMSYEG
jgi:hypothetical protein